MDYRKQFKKEFKQAKERLRSIPGDLYWVDFPYEAFRFKGDGVQAIFYPHKTSAGNYHIRVRDAGSKDKAKFELLCGALVNGYPRTRTFSRNNN